MVEVVKLVELVEWEGSGQFREFGDLVDLVWNW